MSTKAVLEQFCRRFTPNGAILFVNDSAGGPLVLSNDKTLNPGLVFDQNGKLPDVIIHTQEGWLVLVEVVSTNGPMDLESRSELVQRFQRTGKKIVCVTAFDKWADLKLYLTGILWQTKVWIAEEPEHLIHFDGDKQLRPPFN